MTDAPSRALRALLRRPFGRFNSAFYETEAAAATADVVGPVIVERISAHLAAGAGDGPILDVGAGAGAIAAQVAAVTGREVIAVEPSAHSLRRLRSSAHAGVQVKAGSAEDLPVSDHSCAAIYSSCTVKHWRDLDAGIREVLRAAAPGALVLTVEIDGSDAAEVRSFARRTRIPNRLDRLYAATVGRSFNALQRPPADAAAALSRLGATHIEHDRIPGMPFWVLSARAPM